MPDNKDINRVAGGLKAAIHNPNVSEAAKDHAQERLDQINQSEESDVGQESTRVLAGYKATLSVSPWFSWKRCKVTNVFNARTNTPHLRPKRTHARYWKPMDILLRDLMMCRRTSMRHESLLDIRLR